jgi:uncharacterized membrane protein
MNARLEAFCDGVFAIAATLLIIDVKLPSPENIHTTDELWLALKHLSPGIFAFLLSFTIIIITWVNHHAILKLVHKSSPAFIYANGLLLLTVVIVPFPTSLLGEFILSDHAAPAVVLYSSVCGLQAIAWNLIGRAALNHSNPLSKNEKATLGIRNATRKSYYAFALYTVCAILAFWFPLIVAITVAVTWIAWLIVGISIKEE